MKTNGQQLSPLVEPNRPYRLTGKVAIITGAANGIGRAMATLFSQERACIVVADIDQPNGQAAVEEIKRLGTSAIYVETDIAKPSDAQRMVEATMNHFGRLDILVNNASVGLNRPFLDTTLEDWQHTLDIGLTGTFLCAQAAARCMVQQKFGAIINIASISGQRGAQGRTAYGVAKAGVIQLTKVMAVELAALGVRVNAISPGPVDTNQSRSTHTSATRQSYHERIPLGRYGDRDEIAAAALFLASDEARFIHGHILNVDGGYHAAGLMFEDRVADHAELGPSTIAESGLSMHKPEKANCSTKARKRVVS